MIDGEGLTLPHIRRRIEDCELELTYLRAREQSLMPKLLESEDQLASLRLSAAAG